MECQKCGTEIHNDDKELCDRCEGAEMSNIPPGVFLNQIGGGQYRPPTNIPLQTLAGKELAKKKITDVILSLGLLIMLTVIAGLIVFVIFR